MLAGVHIEYELDGATHEERWPSIAAFRAWAQLQPRLRYAAYREDDDGELVLIERGSAGGGRA